MATLQFTLNGPIVPKARPRMTLVRGKMIPLTPENYRNWKKAAIVALKAQYGGPTATHTNGLTLVLSGKHSRRGDLDNTVGSILDALVESGILLDDNMLRVPALTLRMDWDKIADPVATIELIDPVTELKVPGQPVQYIPAARFAA